LQSHLTEIVSTGIVSYFDSSLKNMLADNELLQLSRSEHPVLRATAFREMLERKSFNHFDIIMNHLDDTATVATDAGEFGIWRRKVSDDILQEAGWKTQEAKNKTIDKVLTKHNYLRSAYLILLEIEPQEKYYPFIKDMASRPRRLSYDGWELDFDDIEYALYGLAKFKKKDDVKIIKNRMMQRVWELSDISFRLMKEYPDTAYLDVLQTYHHRQLYQFSGNTPDGFSGVIADRAAPEDFIQALVIQKNDKSAKQLDTMLTYLPKYTCMPDKQNILKEVIMEIWEHPCPAYASLREKIKPKVEEINKRQIGFTLGPIEIESSKIPIDTTKENIRWYP